MSMKLTGEKVYEKIASTQSRQQEISDDDDIEEEDDIQEE